MIELHLVKGNSNKNVKDYPNHVKAININEVFSVLYSEGRGLRIREILDLGFEKSERPFVLLDVFLEFGVEFSGMTLENETYARVIENMFKGKSQNELVFIAMKMAQDKTISRDIFFKDFRIRFNDGDIYFNDSYFVVPSMDFVFPFVMFLNTLLSSYNETSISGLSI